jgi:hypothetical protein
MVDWHAHNVVWKSGKGQYLLYAFFSEPASLVLQILNFGYSYTLEFFLGFNTVTNPQLQENHVFA